jgi:hypothetical protein
MVIVNIYQIYNYLYGIPTSKTGKRDPTAHRRFIKDLINLLFLYRSENYANLVKKPYPSYIPTAKTPGRKPKYTNIDPLLTETQLEISILLRAPIRRPLNLIPMSLLPFTQLFFFFFLNK